MRRIGGLAGFILLLAAPAWADEAAASAISAGDTAWILTSAAMVLLMTPALAMFYGGMVRAKNVLGTLMHSFVAIGLITVQWILVGYTLSFGSDFGGFIGGMDWFGLAGVGSEPSKYAPTIPHMAFMVYQCMFAVITPALISGAIAERVKFGAYVVFVLLWSTLVYDPVCHWIWGGGWLGKLGVMDFAGGLVVHLSSGISALIAALYIGKRKYYGAVPMMPHNLPITVLGAGLLWFGWFGFNAGSALSAGALSTTAFVTTHVAASTAMLVWLLMEWIRFKRATMFGAATGAVAGLATITPAAGFVTPIGAVIIGALAAIVCYQALRLKDTFGYDDSLDAFGVHGVGGVIGTLSAGLLATVAVNSAGANGLFYGNAHALVVQLIGVVAVGVYSIACTWVILKVIDVVMGLRISDDHELMGLDLSQHSESGYDIGH